MSDALGQEAARLQAATRAVFVAFIGAGFAFASWASRIPQVRDRLDLSSAQLGVVLLAIAVGSLTALAASGVIVARFGSQRTVAGMAVVLTIGLAVVAIGFPFGVPFLVLGLFVFGLGAGAWDVAMNVQGAVVEQLLRRSIMSRFHAGFSFGTVGGALLGTAMVALGVSVTAHLLVVAAVVGVGVVLGVRGFVADVDTEAEAAHDGPAPSVLDAWREPRTLLIGVFTLAFAFAEGAGNDWISVAAIDGYGAPAALGTLTFALFLTAMTAGRWVGPDLLDRFGRVRVVRSLGAVAVVGVVLFVFSPVLWLATAGAVLWGIGIALGFPVGMSAGADDPRYAPVRVSVVSAIGYCAFLGGPPLVGFLGAHSTVLDALLAVAVLLGVAALVASATRPLTPVRQG